MHPEPALIPADPKLRGKTIWFEEFADTILVACGAKIFFNRIVAPRFLGAPGDLEAAAQAEINELPPILDYLERIVPDEGGYLVGDALTLADIAVAGPFANFRHTDTRDRPERYPRTVAYVERILARPSLAQWIERETRVPRAASGRITKAPRPLKERGATCWASALEGAAPRPSRGAPRGRCRLSIVRRPRRVGAAALLGEVGPARSRSRRCDGTRRRPVRYRRSRCPASR